MIEIRTDAEREACRQMNLLLDEIRYGRGDGAVADAIRDRLDALLSSLTTQARRRVESLAEDFNRSHP